MGGSTTYANLNERCQRDSPARSPRAGPGRPAPRLRWSLEVQDPNGGRRHRNWHTPNFGGWGSRKEKGGLGSACTAPVLLFPPLFASFAFCRLESPYSSPLHLCRPRRQRAGESRCAELRAHFRSLPTGRSPAASPARLVRGEESSLGAQRPPTLALFGAAAELWPFSSSPSNHFCFPSVFPAVCFCRRPM